MGGSLRGDDGLDLGERPLAPPMCHTPMLAREAYVSGNPEYWAGSQGCKINLKELGMQLSGCSESCVSWYAFGCKQW